MRWNVWPDVGSTLAHTLDSQAQAVSNLVSGIGDGPGGAQKLC
jgi:hypothetical protein